MAVRHKLNLDESGKVAKQNIKPPGPLVSFTLLLHRKVTLIFVGVHHLPICKSVFLETAKQIEVKILWKGTSSPHSQTIVFFLTTLFFVFINTRPCGRIQTPWKAHD